MMNLDSHCKNLHIKTLQDTYFRGMWQYLSYLDSYKMREGNAPQIHLNDLRVTDMFSLWTMAKNSLTLVFVS